MKERKYLAISIKHTEYKWKFGKPCVLWGWHQTKDDEKRCFADYTQYPSKAEVYSLQDWLDSGYGDIIKMDEPVHMTIDLCKKWKKYDTVLIDKDEYIGYCQMACLPLAHPTEKGDDTKDKKLTDSEIVKALECCIGFDSCKERQCPMVKECDKDIDSVYKYALDLINRQQAENERLKKVINANLITISTINEKGEIVEHTYHIDIDFIKAKAYKEFADLSIKRICEEVSAPTPSESYIVEKCNQTIDNLLKELERNN